jgi:nicotinamide-nucleotide amidase
MTDQDPPPAADLFADDPFAAVHADLLELSATVAVAESLTGGLLSAALTDRPGSSSVFRGGLVVYATDLKASLAGVSTRLLAERGAVDPDVAIALAQGARTRLGATFGIGITGVAGPDPQDGKSVGTVFIGVAGPRQSTVAEHSFSGSRAAIRAAAVTAAGSALAQECRTLITALRSP